MQQSAHSGTAPISRKLLKTYLADHLAGSTAGYGRISRMATAHVGTPDGDKLTEISRELRMERAVLKRIMVERGFGHHTLRRLIAWVGERLGRLKGNGRFFSVSPLTPLLELELMRSAVAGKLGLWQTLHANAHELRLDMSLLDSLIEQAKQQAEELESLHERARVRSFRSGSPSVQNQDGLTNVAVKSAKVGTSGSITHTKETAPHADETGALTDVAEKPGTSKAAFEHADSLVDE